MPLLCVRAAKTQVICWSLVTFVGQIKNICVKGYPTLPKFTGETYKGFFSGFLKRYDFMQCLSKCIKLYFFQEKLKKKIRVLPYLKFSDPLPETHFLFHLA